MPNNKVEQTRQDTKARYKIFDMQSDEFLRRITRVAAKALGLPIALVTFADTKRVWTDANHGMDLQWTAHEDAFSDYTIQTETVFIVSDALQDKRFSDSPLVIGPPYIRFYAGAPIITVDGYPVGTLSVLTPEPYEGFSIEKQELLRELAQAVRSEVELQQANKAQLKISTDLAFWNKFSKAVALAPDFNEALYQTLSYCAERTKAVICFLASYNTGYETIEYIKIYLTPTAEQYGLDISKRAGNHPKEDVSFGKPLSEGTISDTSTFIETEQLEKFPLLQEMVQAGIRRQFVYPFDLGKRRFGLGLAFDFDSSDLRQKSQILAQDFITRVAPLLMGRLREYALDRANQTLRMINASRETFARAKTPDALFEAACQLAVDVGGYDSSWIGIAQNDLDKSVQIAASAGRHFPALSKIRFTWRGDQDGRGPTCTAIREKKIVLLRDISKEYGSLSWREEALASGFRTSICLPFGSYEDRAIGTITLYSKNHVSFEQDEQNLLIELTDILAKALQNITTKRDYDAALVACSMSEQRIQQVLLASGTVLYTLKFVKGCAFPDEISRNVLNLVGYAPEDMQGPKWWSEHVHPEDLPQAELGLVHVQEAGHYIHRYRIRHRNGCYRWIRDELTLQRDADGNASGVIGVWIDITEHHEAQEEIYRLAHIDPLTSLPNRRLLNERLGEVLTEARRNGSHGALLFIDLDRFKNINDLLGHNAGDTALAEVAGRLRQIIRATDTIARIGGDEFVVLLAKAGSTSGDATAHATKIGEKLIDSIAGKPILLGGQEYYVGASIGFTLFPKPADTIETLVREADTAMYQAKSGTDNVVMFNPTMHQSLVIRHAIEDDIRNALKDKRFEIWLQDQMDNTGTAVSAEALVRLRKRDGGITAPSEFISIAEASGLIVPLGRWILQEACSILRQIGSNRPDYGISVNVSPQQFYAPNFAADVLATLDHFGVTPDSLTLEITENLLVQEITEISKIMGRLADRGVRFSVDDFGTGYSNLHYLSQLPIKELKIDHGFISQIPEDTSSIAIVETVFAMARRLDLDVVAEGVETNAQFSFLKNFGQMRMQGFYFAKPMETKTWLEHHLKTHSTSAFGEVDY